MSKKRLMELAGVDTSGVEDDVVPSETPVLPPESETNTDDNVISVTIGDQTFELTVDDLFNLAKAAENADELQASLDQFVTAADAEDEVEAAEDELGDVEPEPDDDLEGDVEQDDVELDQDADAEMDDEEDPEMDASDPIDGDSTDIEMDDDEEESVKESVGEDNGSLGSAVDAKSETMDDVLNAEEEEPTTAVERDAEDVPSYVKSDLNSMITNHKKQRDYYAGLEDDHGHRGKQEFHEKVVDVAETVKEYLDAGDVKQAAHFITTLMSELQHRFPASVWKFLASGKGQARSLKDYYTEVRSNG